MKTGEMYTMAQAHPKASFKRMDNEKIYTFSDAGVLMVCNSLESNYAPRLNEEWELVREPVDFMTAINSGKSIQPVGHNMWGDADVWLKQKALRLDWINGHWYIES